MFDIGDSTDTNSDFWQHPITQGFHPSSNPKHDGVDFGFRGVPEPGANVHSPLDGEVVYSGYSPTGGRVTVNIPGSGYSEVFEHLNNLYVNPGEHVTAFQTDLGTTGGGVGDKLLHDGIVQPAESQAWWYPWSTGKHLHFSIFKGNTESEINRAWGQHLDLQLNPMPLISDLQQGRAPDLQREYGLSVSGNNGNNGNNDTLLFGIPNPLDGVNGIAQFFQYVPNSLHNIQATIENLMPRVFIGGAGVVIILAGGIFLLGSLIAPTVAKVASEVL